MEKKVGKKNSKKTSFFVFSLLFLCSPPDPPRQHSPLPPEEQPSPSAAEDEARVPLIASPSSLAPLKQALCGRSLGAAKT